MPLGVVHDPARPAHRLLGPTSVLSTGVVVAILGGAVLAATVVGTSPGAEPAGPPHRGEEVPATAMSVTARPANNSAMLVADPTEPRFLIVANRLDGPDFSCALQVSGSGGRGWTTAHPVIALPPGADKCYAPEAAFDRHGVLYYLFVGLRNPGNTPVGAYLTTSTDRAQSFTAPRQVLPADRFMVRMALDPDVGERGRLHLVWLQAQEAPGFGGFTPGGNPIMTAYSDDGGATFSTPVQVSDPERERVVAPALAVGRDHAVHVLYYDLGDDARDYQGLEGPTWEGRWTLVSSTSRDRGDHFDHGVVVDDALAPPERVMLIFTMPPASVATGPDGQVYAAWHDARNGDWDVFFRRSIDGGRSWEAPVRLNDDPLHDGRHQYLPRLAVSPEGRVDAIFYDRRNNVQNRGNDVYYTYSGDGGRSFAPNLRLTTLDSDSRIGARYAGVAARRLVEFGSRLGLLSESTRAVAAWTDTRNEARAATAQDIFVEAIDFPQPGRSPWLVPVGWVLLLAGGTTAVCAAVLLWGRRRGSRPVRSVGSDAAARCAALLGLVVLPSCGDPGYLPADPPVVAVTLREYRFDTAIPVPHGRVVFAVTNGGSRNHRLAIVPLAADVPPIQGQLHGSERRILPEVAGIPDRAPGEGGGFAADLAPGRYAFLCTTVDPDGQSHALKGMATEFRVS